MGGEYRATETNDASLLQVFAHAFRRHCAVVERAVLDPFVPAIRLDDDAERVKARGVWLHMHGNFKDGAGRGRVNGRRNPAVRFAD